MKILALDSSSLVASVAVVEDDNLLGEYTINYKKTHSQTLLPMLDEVVQMIELDLNTIDAIAVSAGPGSFSLPAKFRRIFNFSTLFPLKSRFYLVIPAASAKMITIPAAAISGSVGNSAGFYKRG